MNATGIEPRSYRLDPLDRTGLFLGLGLAQLVTLGASTLFGALLLTAGAPVGVAGLPVAVGAALALGQLGNQRLVDWAPVVGRYVTRRRSGRCSWATPLPLFGPSTDGATPARPAAMPPCLAGVELMDGPPGLGVVRDARTESVAAVLRVRGDEFALLATAEQERLLAGWGDVLAGLAGERSPVARLCWTAYAAPRGLGEHATWAAAQAGASTGDPAWRDYEQLLAAAAPWAVGHEILVTLTVGRGRLRARAAAHAELVDALARAVDAVVRGLRSVGLAPDAPLSAVEIAAALRGRLDQRAPSSTRASLAQRVGLVATGSAGPMAVEESWRHVHVDDGWHCTYWVAEWPRSQRHPAWLEPLLSWDGAIDATTTVRRELTVVMEPVAPSVSRRRVDREAIKLESDAVVREEKGRRVDAHHRRAQQAVAEREQELVGGHAELAYAGLLRISAPSLSVLERGCEAVEQLAREHGVDLRPLYGRQDLAFAASLPLGLGVGQLVTG